MNKCNWEVIDGFASPDEYRRFCTWIEGLINLGEVEQVLVEESYVGSGFEEKWFKCIASSEVWRLVAPQAPFRGYLGAGVIKVIQAFQLPRSLAVC